jgi:hypothetical protein
MGILTTQESRFKGSSFGFQGGRKGLASEAEIRDEEPVEMLRAYGFKHAGNPH